MSLALQKPPAIIRALKSVLFGGREEEATAPAAPAPLSQGGEAMSRELEILLGELLSKKALITSGKLQMLGFEKIRTTLGARWPLLQAAVYKITQEVIRANVTPRDFFMRYREDTYIIVFAQATLEEGALRARRIADEIGRRIAEVNPEALKVIQVDARVGALETKAFTGKDPADTMSAIAGATREDAGACMQAAARAAAARATAAAMKAPKCGYAPLWDLKARSLSAYMCLADEAGGASPLERDMDMLRAAKAELQRMQDRGESSTLLVPVRHGTLFNSESSQKYQLLYRDIPAAHQKNLVFLIVQYMEGLPETTAYWFIPALKTSCQAVYAEMPVRGKTGLAALRTRGIDGIAATVDTGVDEAVAMGHLRAFSELSRAAGFAQILALGVGSLSLATSVGCMGYTYIGGPAIHAPVAAPGKSHRFRYEEIFAGGR